MVIAYLLRLSVITESLSKFRNENQNTQHSVMINDAKTQVVAIVTLYTQCAF